MSNIDNSENSLNFKKVKIQSSDSAEPNLDNDKIYDYSMFKIRTMNSFIIFLNFLTYFFQLFVFYSYDKKYKSNWSCLLIKFGAFQAGQVKNHKEYYRFITSNFIHSSFAHLCGNTITLIFLGYLTESEINNKIHYLFLFLISGIEGNFMYYLFNQRNLSIGSSGAIIGFCGHFTFSFLLNYRRMSLERKYFFGIMFLVLFLNLSYGFTAEGENINLPSHFGGVLGGFAYCVIIRFKSYEIRESNILAKRMFYCSVIFLFVLPLVAIGIVAFKNVPDIADYICK